MISSGVPLGLSWLPAAVGNWAPGVRPLEPFMIFNFAVEIEGLLCGGFTEVGGLTSEIQFDTYREGGVNGYVHKLPNHAEYGNLSFKYGLTSISTLWNWHYNTTQGIIQRKNGTLMLLDRKQIPVMWWNFRNALPVKWSGPTFNATNDEAGFETLELIHEGLSKPLLGQAAALAQGALQMARA